MRPGFWSTVTSTLRAALVPTADLHIMTSFDFHVDSTHSVAPNLMVGLVLTVPKLYPRSVTADPPDVATFGTTMPAGEIMRDRAHVLKCGPRNRTHRLRWAGHR